MKMITTDLSPWDSKYKREKKKVDAFIQGIRFCVAQEIFDFIEDQQEKGNIIGEKGFSAAICLSDLKKMLKEEYGVE